MTPSYVHNDCRLVSHEAYHERKRCGNGANDLVELLVVIYTLQGYTISSFDSLDKHMLIG